VEIGNGLLTIRHIMASVGIGIVLSLAVATPASAHDTDLYWRDGQASVRNHTAIFVYDQVCNPGRAVFTRYYVSTIGGSVRYDLYAPCGAGDSAHHHPQQITKYQLCEVGTGCSGWKYT
jgi:hypothetical protein